MVVDVLRSTSCITMAVKNGAERVIPAVDPGEAASIAGRLGIRDCVLAGERGGIKLPDFNLGNSPAEYSAENVQGKTVVSALPTARPPSTALLRRRMCLSAQ